MLTDFYPFFSRSSLGPMVQSTMVNLSTGNAKDMGNTDLLMVGNMLARGMVAGILDLVLVPGKVGRCI